MASARFLGLDFGTSGARACVIAANGEIEELTHLDFGALHDHEAAAAWRQTLFDLLAQIPIGQRKHLAALAIDGTSATVLACDAELAPLHPPLAYHDARAIAEAERIAAVTGNHHPATGATSGLAKVLWLTQRLGPGRSRLYLNQADWLAALLSGRPCSDTHNALKMGLDPVTNQWPAWVAALTDITTLPKPVRPGETVGLIDHTHAVSLNLPTDCLVRAGTTDSIAAFLATGANQPGEAVTSLGTTLALKLLSATRVESGEYGLYSHWFGRLWLTGGASNAGGGVLRQHFDDTELAALSARIDPQRDTGLDYYPLAQAGERFPIRDPNLAPRLEPRPADRAEFLHALLEGLARIEALGYRRLTELGATPPVRITSCGGGAHNPAYARIRARVLALPVEPARMGEACYGTARLACHGTGLFPDDGEIGS